MEPTSTALSGINFHSMEQMEIFISELEKKKKKKIDVAAFMILISYPKNLMTCPVKWSFSPSASLSRSLFMFSII